MVSKNTPYDHHVSLPADWNLPKFHLGQRIIAKHAFLNTIRTQTGLIVGIEYFSADSYWVIQHDLKSGWHYSIQVDTSDPWYTTSPVLSVDESAISSLTIAPAHR